MAELVLGPLLRHVGERSVTVWVETSAPCVVSILGRTARTFAVHGHHYALVIVDGLEPGTCKPYQVLLDESAVWPESGSRYPLSVLRTLHPDRPRRLVFGSCRHATPESIGASLGYAPDALDTYAQWMATVDPSAWPEAVILLGDQVYADQTSPATKAFIRARRDTDEPPGLEVADFEEYTALYRESWSDPDIRWLLANVPSAMIFDDHDIRDDWNTSYLWRREIELTSWWHDRILGGLTSYWVYQHLGNLSPDQLRADPMYADVRATTENGGDAGTILTRLAGRADREVDSLGGAEETYPVGGAEKPDGVRWSYRTDYGRTRLIVIDTRCGRVLTETERAMISDAEFEWLAEQLDGDYDHLLIGCSLPWLLPWAIHSVESWNEALCAGSRGPRLARLSEKIRRAGDLEHWAAFNDSFERLGGLLAGLARGERNASPASISVLSGDVHHAYVARAAFDPPAPIPVYQLVVSPVHQTVPPLIRLGFSFGWSSTAAAIAAPLARWAKVPRSKVRWTRLCGPFYGNELGTLVLDGRVARFHLQRSEHTPGGGARLRLAAQVPLAWRDTIETLPAPPFAAEAELT